MNILQGLDWTPPSASASTRPTRMIRQKYSAAAAMPTTIQSWLAAAAQDRCRKTVGANHTFFCGAYWATVFDEMASVNERPAPVTKALGGKAFCKWHLTAHLYTGHSGHRRMPREANHFLPDQLAVAEPERAAAGVFP